MFKLVKSLPHVNVPKECGIHLDMPAVKTCKACGLPMCNTGICQGEDYCKVCKNERFIYSLTKVSSQLMFFIFIFGGLLILTGSLDKGFFTFILFLGILPIIIVQRIKISGLFRGLTPKQSLYPALYRLHISNDINFYHEALSMALKAKKNGENINYPLIRYGLLQGILLSRVAVPGSWADEWADILGYENGEKLEEEIINEFFEDILTNIRPGKSIGALPVVAKVVMRSKNEANAKKLLLEIRSHLEQIASEELDYFGDEYLRDVFLAEDYLMEIKTWNEELRKLVDEIFELHAKKFEPPIVPRNQKEAFQLMSEEAARQQRLMQVAVRKSQKEIVDLAKANKQRPTSKELGEVSLEDD